ncbi:MAG: hypothetical protein GY793_09015, partial [Proteobacteria bacterium]|nr:hypothetical protein [Pseudomonadota bacterium]
MRFTKCFRLLTVVFILSTVCTFLHAKEYNLLIFDSLKGEPYKSLREAMLSNLAKLGYKKGKNLNIIYHSIGNYKGKAKRIIKKMQKTNKKIDVIFSNGTSATTALKESILDNDKYKVVFGAVTSPVDVGVIKDFNSPPPHNFTGVCYPIKIKERLLFVKEVLPDAKKFAVVYADMPSSRSYNAMIKKTLKINPELKDIEVIFKKVRFVKSEGGTKRMTKEAKPLIAKLTKDV